MRTKTNYVTFDTETLGGASRPEGVYDLGGIIHTKDGSVVASFHFLIAEHYHKILEKAFYGKRTFHRYQEMLESGEVTMVATEAEAIAIVENLLNLYNVKYVMAYNTSFDLCKTDCRTLIENREFIDIYQMAYEVMAKRTSYKKYCEKHGFLTKKGNPKCSVEVMYGYLNNDPHFIEEHTAFSDALNEKEIFVKCAKAKKKYTKNKHKGDDWVKRD